MKILFLFSQSILNRDNVFCYLRELHYRLLGLALAMRVVLMLSFSRIKKKMAEQNLPVHPRERLPHTAPSVLDTSPKVDLKFGRFSSLKKSSNFALMPFVFNFGR